MGRRTQVAGLALALAMMPQAQANTNTNTSTALDDCLLTQLNGADGEVTLAQVRERCQGYQESVVGAGESALIAPTDPVIRRCRPR